MRKEMYVEINFVYTTTLPKPATKQLLNRRQLYLLRIIMFFFPPTCSNQRFKYNKVFSYPRVTAEFKTI